MMDELKKLPPLSPVEEPPNRLNTKIRRKQQLQQQQQQQTPVRRISQLFAAHFDHNVFSIEADGEEEEQELDQGEARSQQ